MEEKESKGGFRCPEVIPPNAFNSFCIPEACCPERIPTFQFPSATSCLPEEVLEELELKIEAANNFLLDIGLSGEIKKDEIFQRAFKGLVGQVVEIELNCPAEIQEVAEEGETENTVITGRVFLAGRNFSVIREEKKEIIVPHEQICFIRPTNRLAEPINDRSLNEIDPCLRRCLTFRFGEVVSGSPELIQLFFGLDLKVYLLQHIDKKINIRLENEVIEGTLFDVDEETMLLCIGDEKRPIPLADICRMFMKDK